MPICCIASALAPRLRTTVTVQGACAATSPDTLPSSERIVEAARAKGRLVVLKVDCEGSEFAVFRSLAESGLLPSIAAFMVEYHIGWGSGRELTERLVAAGFIVVDLGRPGENGFFYAVRAAAGAR